MMHITSIECFLSLWDYDTADAQRIVYGDSAMADFHYVGRVFFPSPLPFRFKLWRNESPHYSGDKEVDWKYVPILELRDMPAKLLNVCLLELSASRKINPKKSYEIGFRVSLSRGWNSDSPVFIMARRGDGHFVARKVSFKGRSLHEQFDIPDKFYVKFSPQDSSDSESYLNFGMYDYWNSDWKSGLNIHHAFAREVIETGQEE
ncbi:hypothetical protein LguiB_018590 [Lonicera macranthoides]